MKRLPPDENSSFCMAPWTHTHLSPLGERKLCCLSNDLGPYVSQQATDDGEPNIIKHQLSSLNEYWNSETMRSVRRRMLSGEELPECANCDKSIVSLQNYRDHFNKTLFPDLIQKALDTTKDDGSTTMTPVSFDYRFSNTCNFKCRMCSKAFSSSWEIERRQYNDWDPEKDFWMEPTIRNSIKSFQKNVTQNEFLNAVKSGEIRDIYWAGGEPLMWPEHWKFMDQLIEQGHAPQISVRYNTNLSVIEGLGKNLFTDILPHFKNYNVCASIDAAGSIGEFLRSGLNWSSWLKNFKLGAEASRNQPGGLMMDITVTLPGLFGLRELFDVARELDVSILAKIVQVGDRNILLSPHALPRHLLNEIIDELVSYMEPRKSEKTQPLIELLLEIRSRPTFAEKFGAKWNAGTHLRSQIYLTELAKRRGDGINGRMTIEEIYSVKPKVLSWWLGNPINSNNQEVTAQLNY